MTTTQPTNQNKTNNESDNKAASIGKTDLFGLVGGILVVIVSISVFFFTSAYYKNVAKNRAKDTWVDLQGYLHVLGITLHRTTLRDAEKILLSRSDIALYHYPDAKDPNALTLEASFPSLTDHSKVMMKLDATPETLETFHSHATMPRIYPNNVLRLNLAPDDLLVAENLVIESITFIPSAAMDQQTLTTRFGVPGRVSKSSTATYYFYPAIGLKATLSNDDHKVTLNFKSPDDYLDSTLDQPLDQPLNQSVENPATVDNSSTK